MKELIKDHVYGINGEQGLIGRVVSLIKEGKEVCVHSSYHIGNGNYVVAYFNEPEECTHPEEIEIPKKVEEPEVEVVTLEEVVEAVVEDAPEEVAPEEVNTSVEDTNSPDWELAKGFIKDTSLDEASAKEALIDYAGTFGVTKDKFDKRKGYGKLVMTFRGHWNKMNK